MAEVFDALRRDGDSSNTIIGVVILVLLTVFVAPDVLPQLVANTIPFLDEGLPCTQVMTAQDRANHQSLIGRSATDPLSIRAEVLSYPDDGTRPLVVRIVVLNESIGTVPFVFNPNQVIVGDDPNTSGLGVIFTPSINATLDYDRNGVANARVQQNTVPASDIRILGPRQRCVHRVEIPAAQLTAINPGQTRIRAYYRIQNDGVVQQVNPSVTPVYTDQGLRVVNVGFVESNDVTIPLAAFANTDQ
ncbi:MAG: hypothetical protein ACFE0Q_03840 [Anaerolineae bacterium]